MTDFPLCGTPTKTEVSLPSLSTWSSPLAPSRACHKACSFSQRSRHPVLSCEDPLLTWETSFGHWLLPWSVGCLVLYYSLGFFKRKKKRTLSALIISSQGSSLQLEYMLPKDWKYRDNWPGFPDLMTVFLGENLPPDLFLFTLFYLN